MRLCVSAQVERRYGSLGGELRWRRGWRRLAAAAADLAEGREDRLLPSPSETFTRQTGQRPSRQLADNTWPHREHFRATLIPFQPGLQARWLSPMFLVERGRIPFSHEAVAR